MSIEPRRSTISLPTRYYRSIPIDNAGYETEVVELEPERTALVAMHCWNIGCADGPEIDSNYCVGMGFPEAFKEADRIMREQIRPAIDAARRSGILVCHVENDTIAARHPEAQNHAAPPPRPSTHSKGREPVVAGWRAKMAARAHGEKYAEQSPLARMDRAEVVKPLPDEPYVYQTEQFDTILRGRGIQNLLYTGFATDMCILYAAAGVQAMAGYGYRLYLMRDGTYGVEYPDTFEERLATRWGIRIFEFKFGNSFMFEDFVSAL